jgi:hypothetical protein
MADRSTPLNLPSWMLVVLVAALLLTGAQGSSASRDEYRPALILDLRELGYEQPKNFHAQAEYQSLQNSAVFLVCRL